MITPERFWVRWLILLWMGGAGLSAQVPRPATAPVLVKPEPFRAAWIASVFNLNFPSAPGLSAATQKRELIDLLDTAKKYRLNAVFFQVRPEGDALYASTLEPWSRYLTGVQGRSPGFDPLAFLIEEGKIRGVAVHAWINPFRAAASQGKPRAVGHMAQQLKQFCYPVYTSLWMDPGAIEVQDHVVRVVRDIVRRYAVAGIHLDDYFYPYPKDYKHPVYFPDGKTYKKYTEAGGLLSRADWRRRNVNQLILRLHRMIRAEAPAMRFGISPFGIYTQGQPSTVKVELDQYQQLYADPVQWMKEGSVDYLVPQLYWRDKSEQSFSALLAWWRSPAVNPQGVPIYPGIAVERLGGGFNWPVSEIARQLELEQKIGPRPGVGMVFWNIKPLQRNQKGVGDLLRK
jgi:uncharacterized lipoprotein YddW (UPF0748 family)